MFHLSQKKTFHWWYTRCDANFYQWNVCCLMVINTKGEFPLTEFVLNEAIDMLKATSAVEVNC